jgi:SRSO17 transposase
VSAYYQRSPETSQFRPGIHNDTGFPKKGRHSVGVARQYCGQLGKQNNCQVAVSLSVATHQGSLPVAYRLYLPKEWANDPARRAIADLGASLVGLLCASSAPGRAPLLR